MTSKNLDSILTLVSAVDEPRAKLPPSLSPPVHGEVDRTWRMQGVGCRQGIDRATFPCPLAWPSSPLPNFYLCHGAMEGSVDRWHSTSIPQSSPRYLRSLLPFASDDPRRREGFHRARSPNPPQHRRPRTQPRGIKVCMCCRDEWIL